MPETKNQPMPVHVAIIMDGNGRWAKKRMLPRVVGHRKGADAVRATVKACANLGIEYLTLYAFSSENWKRPADEVDDLMGLLRIYLRQELKDLHKNNVRIRFIGERAALASDIKDMISNAEKETSENTGLNLIIALNYGARAEIMSAAKAFARDVVESKVSIDDLDENSFSERLETKDIPDPDVIIRTSGEQRLSNFLLWQAAYAELLFTDVLWPDFNQAALEVAIEEYQQRDRRFGARP
ncbi:MAG: isoprenyl transferase [Sphingomonadales bacterium]